MSESIENIKGFFDPNELIPGTNEPKYKTVADLPESVRHFYVDLPQGGFVRKSAKKLFDRKSAELKKMGFVRLGKIEKAKHDHITEKGLGISTKEYLRRIKSNIVDTLTLGKEDRIKKEDEQHVNDVVSKIRQDEADPLANGSEFSRVKNEIEDAFARVEDQVAFNEDEHPKVTADILKEKVKQELIKIDKERKSKGKGPASTKILDKKTERAILDELA